MLSGSMAHYPFRFRMTSIVSLLAAAIVLAGCSSQGAATTQAPMTGASCQTTSVIFVGFGNGLADIQQDGMRLWEGRLAEYDPSTDISGEAEICARSELELVLRAGEKTYRALLPDKQPRHFVLIDFRSAEPTIQGRPFLLD